MNYECFKFDIGLLGCDIFVFIDAGDTVHAYQPKSGIFDKQLQITGMMGVCALSHTQKKVVVSMYVIHIRHKMHKDALSVCGVTSKVVTREWSQDPGFHWDD